MAITIYLFTLFVFILVLLYRYWLGKVIGLGKLFYEDLLKFGVGDWDFLGNFRGYLGTYPSNSIVYLLSIYMGRKWNNSRIGFRLRTFNLP